MTAFGVRLGIEAAVKFRLGKDSLDGIRIAVHGVGHVGLHLCRLLHEAGAELVVADVSQDAVADITLEMLGAATADARRRAEVLAAQQQLAEAEEAARGLVRDMGPDRVYVELQRPRTRGDRRLAFA